MELVCKAYAKLNLSLQITGCRADGYHTLCTVMQSISLHDCVSIRSADDKTITFACSEATIANSQNLAYQAAEVFLSTLQKPKTGVQIYLKKSIPMAAGLGGGSADAAAVLRGMNQLYQYPFDSRQLAQMALTLGADIPFCLEGGTKLATGIGEVLQPLASCPDCGFVIVFPCEKESTGAMYQKYDKIKGLSAVENCDIINKLQSGDIAAVAKEMVNDFMPLYETNAVRTACTALQKQGALGSGLSGSGPSVFGIYKDMASALQAANSLPQYVPIITAAPVDAGVAIERI